MSLLLLLLLLDEDDDEDLALLPALSFLSDDEDDDEDEMGKLLLSLAGVGGALGLSMLGALWGSARISTFSISAVLTRAHPIKRSAKVLSLSSTTALSPSITYLMSMSLLPQWRPF